MMQSISRWLKRSGGQPCISAPYPVCLWHLATRVAGDDDVRFWHLADILIADVACPLSGVKRTCHCMAANVR